MRLPFVPLAHHVVAPLVSGRTLALTGAGACWLGERRRGTVERTLVVEQEADPHAPIRLTVRDYDGHEVGRELPSSQPLRDLLDALFGPAAALLGALVAGMIEVTPIG